MVREFSEEGRIPDGLRQKPRVLRDIIGVEESGMIMTQEGRISLDPAGKDRNAALQGLKDRHGLSLPVGGEDKEVETPHPRCDRPLPPRKFDSSVGSSLCDQPLQDATVLSLAENENAGVGALGTHGGRGQDGRGMVLGGMELGDRSDQETVWIEAEHQTFRTAVARGMKHRGIGGVRKSGDLRGIKANPRDEVEPGLFGKGRHMVGHPEDLPEEESLPARQIVERLVLVDHQGNTGEFRRQTGEELIMVGLSVDDPGAVFAKPARQLPDPERIHPLRWKNRDQLHGESFPSGLFTQHAEIAKADKGSADSRGEMAVQGKEKILGTADRHRDKRVDDPKRIVLPGSLYHWRPKRMIPFGFSGLSGSHDTLS